MKQILTIIVFLIHLKCFGQLSGSYKRWALGEQLEFINDTLFSYELHYDTDHRKGFGTYKINKDTVTLIYRFYQYNSYLNNSNHDDSVGFIGNAMNIKPEKYYLKNNKLYPINNKGKIIKKISSKGGLIIIRKYGIFRLRYDAYFTKI